MGIKTVGGKMCATLAGTQLAAGGGAIGFQVCGAPTYPDANMMWSWFSLNCIDNPMSCVASETAAPSSACGANITGIRFVGTGAIDKVEFKGPGDSNLGPLGTHAEVIPVNGYAPAPVGRGGDITAIHIKSFNDGEICLENLVYEYATTSGSSSSSSSSSASGLGSSSAGSSSSGGLVSLLTSNGTFTTGAGMFAAYSPTLTHVVSFAGGVADFAIATASFELWQVQMTHPVALVAGVSYTLCYDAMASSARTIAIDFDDAGPTYGSLTGGVTPMITAAWASYSFTFAATATDPTARVAFNLGSGLGELPVSMKLDNIGVYQGTACPAKP